MDPRLYSASQRQSQESANLEQQIKDTFYNSVAEFVLLSDNVTLQNIDDYLLAGIRHTMTQILDDSRAHDGIRLPTGSTVTNSNCPLIYRELLTELLTLKSSTHANPLNAIELNAVIMRIMRLASFRALNPKQFLLEAKGLTQTSSAAPLYDETNVTPELIRESFYNEMVIQALLAKDNGWLTLSNIEDQDALIFTAFPALTLLEAIQQSQHCNGIRLLNNKIMNERSCPRTEGFPDLFRLIMGAKEKLQGLNDRQIYVIKHIVSSDDPLPADLEPLKTHELMTSVAAIKNMAMIVANRRVFHAMVAKVWTVCMQTLVPEPAAPRP